MAEGGTSSANLALDTKLLWAKSPSSQQCPQKLDFDLMLPTTFTYEGITYASNLFLCTFAPLIPNLISLYPRRTASN